MKFLIFFGIFLLATCNEVTFEQFVQIFNKTYLTEEEMVIARTNYDAHLEYIKSFNSGRGFSFTQEINHMSDLGIKQRRRLNSFKLSIFSNILSEDNAVLPRGEVPDEVDWRNSGFVSPVQDQGFYCGSCWAYSTTGVLEGAIALKNKTAAVKLSEQQFIDCNYNSLIGNYGCGGGFMAIGLAYARSQDLMTNEKYPYIESASTCVHSKPQSKYSFSMPIMLPPGDENALKIAVANYGPIATAIDASQDSFFGYSKGIYNDPNCTKWLNHAVLVVGYGTDPDGNDYWIIKNSWSEFWGEGGYIKLARNKNNHCGIAKYGVYIRCNKVNNNQ